MEEKVTNKNKTVQQENQNVTDVQFSKTELQDNKLVINQLECKANANMIIKAEANEKNIKNDTTVLKRKVTEDGVMIERVLSEGEASSGFETVSSYDSKADFDELDLSSSYDGDEFNVIVKIENELAFQNTKESIGRVCYRKDRSNSPVRYNRTDRFLGEYRNRRRDSYKSFKEQKYGDNNNLDKYYKSDRKDKMSNDREDYNRSRRSTCEDRSRRSLVIRRSNRKNRFRRNRSSERINRSRSSRSSERNIRLKSPCYKEKNTEVRLSGSFDRNSTKSYTKKNSPSKKRRHSPFSKSPSSSVWKRLDNRLSPSRRKITNGNKKINSHGSFNRKKERTPFLVELERKLKEAEHLKNFKKETSDGFSDQNKACGNVNATVPMPEEPHAINQNSNSLLPATFMPPVSNVQKVIYPLQYVSMPTLSMDNLPLVPGPTGLPVHITVTGEQIPYDMDGRRIPIGPNGYYLPVDPTGRLFPHIVSPGNQAIPIHMTDDGVLRLPNSEPVPCGPGHQLPVNIDGSVILLGPESKPLYPCPNLPKEPPFNLLQMMDSFNGGCVMPQQTMPVIPQPPQTGVQQNLVIAAQQALNFSQINHEASSIDLGLLEFIHSPTEKINKADLLKKYKEKALEKNEDVLKCVDIKRNLALVNPSKAGIRRSIPVNLLQRKNFKDDNYSSGSDMVLDSGDSDSASGVKYMLESSKDLTEEMLLSSDDEKSVLKIVCDNESNKAQNIEEKQEDPIVRKIQQAIKSLRERNYKPPAFGRFITNLTIDTVLKEAMDESPLLRDRIRLPFLIPYVKDASLKEQSATEKNTEIHFKFLSRKKLEKGERPSGFKYNKLNNRNFTNTKLPVLTFDFAMQCDFTSVIIKKLTSKVSELETELVRLRNVNANLVDDFRNVQALNEKKSDELMKAMREIQERNCEIRSLKRSVEKQ